ncbi:MAG: hypothetical protein K6B28_04055 [Lachnospiraceae bacterium]|nr:hypothetical protein [Lachnospiraceae bacterium]
MKKEILAVLLATCTMASLVACGGSAPAPAADAGQTEEEAPAEEAADETETAEEEKAPAPEGA